MFIIKLFASFKVVWFVSGILFFDGTCDLKIRFFFSGITWICLLGSSLLWDLSLWDSTLTVLLLLDYANIGILPVFTKPLKMLVFDLKWYKWLNSEFLLIELKLLPNILWFACSFYSLLLSLFDVLELC